MIYFLLGEKTRLVKIGQTTQESFIRRMNNYKTHSPDRLELLGVIRNEVWAEKSIHVRFGSLWEHGEWFRESEELLAFIKKECDPHSRLPATLARSGKKQDPKKLKQKFFINEKLIQLA